MNPSSDEPNLLREGVRVGALDAVRGIAIALVILRHAFPEQFGAGNFVGVEIFFVLSGFLITGILLRGLQSETFSYRRFYRNRALRLFPALLLLVLVCVVVAETTNPLDKAVSLPQGLFTALTYTSDIPAWPLDTYLELQHLWTLSVEEQFYLVWPLLIAAIVARKHDRLDVAAAILVVLTGALLVGTVGLYQGPNELGKIYTWPMTWAVTLVAGCALAMSSRRVNVSAAAGTVVIVLLIALALLPEAKGHNWGYLVVIPATGLLALALILNATSERPSPILLFGPLRSLGTVSYGAYLWNGPMHLWFDGLITIPLTLIAAILSYVVVEKRFLRLKTGAAEPAARRDTVGAGAS